MALDWNGMNPENPEVYEISSWSSLGRPEYDKKKNMKTKYVGPWKHNEIGEVEVVGNRFNNFVEKKSGNNIHNENNTNYIKYYTNDNFLTNTKVMFGATFDFINTYNEMIEANFENQDKYFHAKANFLATSRGPMGEFMAIHLSNFRELFGQIKGDPIQDMDQDQVANRFGRKQAKFYNSYDFREALKIYRPKKLPKKY